MAQSYVEVINGFKYNGGEIFELKFCSLPKEAAKEFRFQWFLIYDMHRYDLKFVSFEDNIRLFTSKKLNAKVEIDCNNMTLLIKKNDQTLSTIYKLYSCL
jgi:hypothetical protein